MVMQGDSYGIVLRVSCDGEPVTSDDVADVEITMGFLIKTYLNQEIFYDSDGLWIFPITQEESFRFPSARVKPQVRVKWLNGDVEGMPVDEISIEESRSKVVL